MHTWSPAVCAVMGRAFTVLTLSGSLGPDIQFKLNCKGCALFLNGLLVIELWEAMGTPISLAKTSGWVGEQGGLGG